MFRFLWCLLGCCCGGAKEGEPEGQTVRAGSPRGSGKVKKRDEVIWVTYIDNGRQPFKSTIRPGEVVKEAGVKTAADMEDSEKVPESIKATDSSAEMQEETNVISATATEDTVECQHSFSATASSDEVEEEVGVMQTKAMEDSIKATVSSAEMAVPDAAASLNVDPDAASSTATHTCARLPQHLGNGLIVVTGPPKKRGFTRCP